MKTHKMGPVEKNLRAARRVLNERGLTKHTFRSPSGRVCAYGALRSVVGFTPFIDAFLAGEESYLPEMKILEGFAKQRGASDVPDFNDNLARNKRDVLDLYDDAIQFAKPGGV